MWMLDWACLMCMYVVISWNHKKIKPRFSKTLAYGKYEQIKTGCWVIYVLLCLTQALVGIFKP